MPAGTLAGSTVIVAERVSPAGIVSESVSSVSASNAMPADSGPGSPSPAPGVVSPSVAVRATVISASVRFVYSTMRSTGVGSSPHISMPKSPEPDATTGASSAASTSMTPVPPWYAV